MKTHKRRKSFDLLSKYDSFLPSTRDLVVLVLMLIGGVGLGSALMLVLRHFCGADFAMTYGTMITYPLQFLPAMWYASARVRVSMNFDDAPAAYPVDSGRFFPLGGPLAVILAVVATWCCTVVTEPTQLLLPKMPASLKAVMDQLTKGPLWVSLISTAVFAPFFEEWLCRGVILRGLLPRMKPVWAIVISAAFFGVMHMNPWQAINAFFLGCLFGLVYYKTGSLKLSMLLHAVANATSVFVSRIPAADGVDYLWQLIGNTHIYAAVFTLCALGLAAIVAIYIRIEFIREPEESM